MAHYAFIDENNTHGQNIVVSVITGRDEFDTHAGVTDWEAYYGNVRGLTCKRTSYNTAGGEHAGGGVPFRKNYAGIGFTYDEERDAFIPPKPFESWVLDEDTCLWEAPVPMPEETDADGEPVPYTWDEDAGDWVVVEDV